MKPFRADREWLRQRGWKPGDGKGGIVSIASGNAAPAKAPRPQIRVPRARTPNATEQRWRNSSRAAEFTNCRFDYEAISFRLASGANYRPDWSIWHGSRLVACVECKGGYRLHSHSRAALAWKTAANEWPHVTWIWAKWDATSEDWVTTEVASLVSGAAE